MQHETAEIGRIRQNEIRVLGRVGWVCLPLAAAALLACGGAGVTADPAPAKAAYGYEFDVDTRAAATATTPKGQLQSGPGGRLPPEAIQSVVHEHFDEIWKCYAAAQQRDPELRGQVNVRYVINEAGAPSHVADAASSIADKEVVSCVLGVFRSLKYSDSSGGEVQTLYPIRFEP